MSELLEELKKARVCIYGCGECGIQTCLLLREKGIHIDFFGDRDQSKKGYVVDGVFCITLDELLLKEIQNITLIVAVAHGKGLADEFQKKGFKKVLYYENVRLDLCAEQLGGQGNLNLMKIEELQRLKQYIQELANRKDLSVESKRDSILKLCEREQRGV